MLRNREIFGGVRKSTIYLHMTFKELANDLMLQGWRVYKVNGCSSEQFVSKFHPVAVRKLLEFQVYEGRNLIFVKTVHPPIREKTNK